MIGQRLYNWLTKMGGVTLSRGKLFNGEHRKEPKVSKGRFLRDIPGPFTGISSLTGRISVQFQWTAQNDLTGSAYNPTTNSSAIDGVQAYSTNSANNTPGGSDEVFSFQIAIDAAGTSTLNLDAMTNLLQQSGVAIVRIKGLVFRLLSGTNDPTISPVPTATSYCTIGNIGIAVPATLFFGQGNGVGTAGGNGGTVVLTGSGTITGVAVGAGGTGYPPSTFMLMSPQQVGGSGCVFLATVNSSGVISAATFITGAGGSGYTAATVPMIPVGQFVLLTGGAHVVYDPSGPGFMPVSSTGKNILISNCDAGQAITVEVDVFGGST